MKKYLIFLAIALLPSCTPEPKPLALARSHMELIKSGKTTEAAQQYCSIGEKVSITNLTSFKILSDRSVTNKSGSFTEVRVETMPDSKVLNILVFKSDDAFEQIKNTALKFNQDKANSPNSLVRTAADLPIPLRSEVNSAELCIFVPVDNP